MEAAKMQNVLLNSVQHECDRRSAQCGVTQCIKDVYRYRPGNCTFACDTCFICTCALSMCPWRAAANVWCTFILDLLYFCVWRGFCSVLLFNEHSDLLETVKVSRLWLLLLNTSVHVFYREKVWKIIILITHVVCVNVMYKIVYEFPFSLISKLFPEFMFLH